MANSDSESEVYFRDNNNDIEARNNEPAQEIQSDGEAEQNVSEHEEINANAGGDRSPRRRVVQKRRMYRDTPRYTGRPSYSRSPSPAVVHQSRSSKPMMKPSVFTGAEDWESYITQFEVCGELGHWSNTDKALILAASLRGKALDYFANIPKEDRQSYGSLVYKLEQRFGTLSQQSKWLSKLESRKRASTESMSAYADDIVTLMRRAYPNIDTDAQEVMSLNAIYRDLNPELRYQCIREKCQTVVHAVQVIETYESIVGLSSATSIPQVRMVKVPESNSKPEDSRLQKSLDTIMDRLDRLEQRNNRPYRRPQPSDRNRCYTCNSPSHFRSNCPKNATSQGQVQQGSGNVNPSFQ